MEFCCYNKRENIMPLPPERTYTIEDIYALPNGQRAELIAGQIYLMAPSARIHQIMLNQTLALSVTRIN